MTTTTMTADGMDFVPPEKQKTFFGHPAGLFVLFFTEMWERFSYYGMRSLLVLYMTQYLIKDPERAARVFGFEHVRAFLEIGFGPLSTQALSSQLYGLYTGIVYLSPFFGGIIADKVWGQKRTVYVGGILMAIGHFLMANENMFLLALAFLILGNGCFKPNISTQVGSLYQLGDPRRDGAFTIFYMGVNLGAFFSPIVCGTLGQSANFGWHWGFGAAGVGMIAGLIIYHFGRRYLPLDRHQLMSASEMPSSKERMTVLSKTVLGFLGVVIAFFLILVIPPVAKAIVLIVAAVAIIYTISKLEADERRRVTALCLIALGAVGFWVVYEQQGNTMQLWADEKTVWPVIFGFQIPSTWFQSFNAGMIFIFAPLLDGVWSARAKKGKTSTSIRKMGIGCILLGLAFIIMIACAKVTGEGMKSGLEWLFFATIVVTLGELYLSPIGLSLYAKVAPKRMASMMMGVYFLATFIGNYLSGYVGSFYEKMSKDSFFLMLCVIGVSIGLLFISAEKKMKQAIGDV